MSVSGPGINLERWEPVLDALADALGVPIHLIDAEGQPLTRVDIQRAPWEVLTQSPRGFGRYADCVQALLLEARQHPRVPVNVQAGGLHLYAIPVLEGGVAMAYLILGPCLVGRRGEPDDYMALAKEFNIRIDLWMEALQEIKVFSFIGVNAATSLLQRIGDLMCPAGIAREAIPAMWDYLLDAALHAVEADAGSILVQGPTPNELVIQTARGLRPEILRTARVRVGEGIAGRAAADRVALRVNAKDAPPQIRAALRRPELHDAMVVPIAHGARLVGILCVSATNRRLRDNGLTVLKSLTGLVKVALTN